MELNTIPTDFFNMDELVADYLIEGQWNLNKLREVGSTDVLSLIMNTPTGFGNEMQDTFIFGPSPNGLFSVKSAFNLCIDSGSLSFYQWSFILKLRIPLSTVELFHPLL